MLKGQASRSIVTGIDMSLHRPSELLVFPVSEIILTSMRFTDGRSVKLLAGRLWMFGLYCLAVGILGLLFKL